jgi:hypothetical protein
LLAHLVALLKKAECSKFAMSLKSRELMVRSLINIRLQTISGISSGQRRYNHIQNSERLPRNSEAAFDFPLIVYALKWHM